jgi:GPH family glycoside/pentoside/hexuronide:cation symporter
MFMAISEDLSEWEVAPTSKMISYGFGYLIVNYLIGAGFSLVFYYYEVEVGLPVLFVGLAFLVYALWNMVNDPLLGYFTDKPRRWTRKWGLRAPWVIISAFPMLICYYFIFSPPDINPKENALTIFLYMIIVTALFDTFFSIFNTHVYGGFTNQFKSEYERRRGFAIIIAIAGFGVVGIRLIPPFIIEYGNRSSFATSALIVVICLAICNLFLFLGIKESEGMKEMFIRGFEKTEEKGFFSVMKISFTHRNFVVSLIGYTSIITAQTLSAASGIYMMKDVYKVPYTYAVFTALAGLTGYIISIPFWYNYARKHGFKHTYYVALFFAGCLYLPVLFITSIWHAVILVFFGGIPYAGYTVMTMPVASDTMDEVATSLGRRQDGTLQGIRNFFFRIALVVQGIVLTTIHIITGYNPDPKATQTPLAIIGIRIHAGLIPALIMFTMCAIFYKFYTLEGAEKEAMIKKLKEMELY